MSRIKNCVLVAGLLLAALFAFNASANTAEAGGYHYGGYGGHHHSYYGGYYSPVRVYRSSYYAPSYGYGYGYGYGSGYGYGCGY